MPGVCAAGSQSLVPGPGVRQETPQSGEDSDSVGHPTGRGWFAGEPRGGVPPWQWIGLAEYRADRIVNWTVVEVDKLSYFSVAEIKNKNKTSTQAA